jgi:ribonuclease HI
MNQSGKLRKVLGKWTRQNENRVHLNYCNKDASLLYTRDQNGNWQAHTQKCSGRRCLFFYKTSHPVNSLPQTIIPVDIKLQTEELILIEGCFNISPEPNEQETCGNLTEYIRMTAAARAEKIMLLIDEPEIHDILRNPTRIEVASDGGFDPSTGISSYGWVIAFNRTLIAKGRGPAEAHPDLAESFRAEGYGLASVAAFLMAMVTFLKVTVNDHSWKFYIDNKAMIQRMESYSENIKHSKWNIRADADITNKAYYYIRHIPALLLHVKSHQDEGKSNKLLSYDAHLNIIADALASQQREQMQKPVTKVTGDHCHLIIKDRYITRDSKKWLLQKAGEIPIQHYYKTKYGWSRSVFDSIDWDLQQKVLRTYSQNDQRRLLKFAHDWLPTNFRLYREEQEQSPACRLCGDLEETNDHLLRCQHPRQQQTRLRVSDYLWKDNENHGNSELNNIIELALSESIHNKEWKPVMSAISEELLPCIRQQNKIGWHHMFKGRIARDMTKYMETHYRTLPIDSKKHTGERWGKMLLRNIWNMVLQLWETRNEIIHGNQVQDARTTERLRLEHRVRKYYEMMTLLDQTDREKVFYKEEDTLLSEDTRYIKAWLRIVQRVFAVTRKERQKPKNEQRMMEQYFSWRPPAEMQKRKLSTPRAPDENHPD